MPLFLRIRQSVGFKTAGLEKSQ